MAPNPAIRALLSPIKPWDPLVANHIPTDTPLSGRHILLYNSYYEMRFPWDR